MGNNAGNRNDDNQDDPIPFSAPLPAEKKTSVIPVAIAAFVGALAGAVVGVQLS